MAKKVGFRAENRFTALIGGINNEPVDPVKLRKFLKQLAQGVDATIASVNAFIDEAAQKSSAGKK